MEINHSVQGRIGTSCQTTITAGRNTIISDEPIALGGKEEGFNPFELLASSLAACTCATLRMYADRKQWPLTGVETEVTITRSDSTTTTVFTRHIKVSGELDETQKSRILAIANACPVHKMLSGTVEIKTDMD
ncbi:OsmC-like protein [compost metagenome]